MESDIISTIAELMVSGNENLSDRLCREQEILNRIKCTNSKIGSWIDDFELPVLLEILDSPDSYFYKNFPNLKSLNYQKRQDLAEKIQNHAGVCEHCKLKIKYDTDWEIRVNAVIEQNRSNLENINCEVEDCKHQEIGSTILV